ncbi:hypothetical protein PYCCODRAFT_1471200 [Trametes coccinea BRFM310]|uniref:GTP-binding protein n=1 Tax=Trametes coccinea (strain BRFM310) TaxID=1353009 RepID=A0A1Y2IAY4_TRAC3|nr:hypothetical protein PYCCODRAFT_1471200 [Trametes coccinea BRFM310]
MSRTASSSRPPPQKSADANGKAAVRDDVIRTKILLLGMRRSGKTSIRQVLFNNLSPRETLYLETTTQLIKHPFNTVIPLEIWDCPGDTTLETLSEPVTEFATMIFVIDIQLALRTDSLYVTLVHLPLISSPEECEESHAHPAMEGARSFRARAALYARAFTLAMPTDQVGRPWSRHSDVSLLFRSATPQLADAATLTHSAQCLPDDLPSVTRPLTATLVRTQDLYQQPIQKLVDFVVTAYQENPNMNLEVFVHKADVLTEEYKFENFREIQQRVSSELAYINFEYEQIPINFQLTSIYDHSLHDAFSRVLHKLIDSLPYLEDLLNVFCANSQASKAFLFDTASRLYVATDASPVDPPTHNLCSDYLQTLNAFGPLYKSVSASPFRMRNDPSPASAAPSMPASPLPQPKFTLPSASTSQLASPISPSPPRSSTQSPNTSSTILPVPITASPSPLSPPVPSSTSTPTSPSPNPSAPTPSSPSSPPSRARAPAPRFYPSAAASLAPTATVGGAAGAGVGAGQGAPAGGTTLTYHLITPQLALLALVPSGVFAARRGLVEYNVVFFREGVQEICEVEAEARRVK